MRTINEDDLMEQALGEQIPEFEDEKKSSKEETYKNEAAKYIGQKLQHKIGGRSTLSDEDKEEMENIKNEKKLSKIGDNVFAKNEIREGWMEVNRDLLGQRNIFYPESWKFRIRPANVEAIRNWSTIDDENANSIDDVFNEILKSCLAIITPQGPLPWGNIRSWDRLFFILLIRDYTFVNGEKAIKFAEDCPNCDNPVEFVLNSMALDYDLPDPEVMPYFDAESQTWTIDPTEFDVNEDIITLYLPTLEKDAAIKSWMISRIRENKKIDNVFVRFLIWLAPKISKDEKIASRQIREYEMRFKSWDTDMFSLMNDIVKNIQITPSSRLITKCPVCGEEVTAEIRFPDGVSSLFNVQNKHKKFGKK